MIEVYGRFAVPPELAVPGLVAVTVALIAAVVTGLMRARRRDALAAAAEARIGTVPPVLAEGRDVVLTGIVRHFEDHAVAVKVSVTQKGRESESSGSWSHSWIEIDREIVLAPFWLELASGELVLVQPPKTVEVADALDQKVWIDRNHRVLSAELVPGERIHAWGRLERSDQATAPDAYRDVKWGWALQPANGRMLLSSEPLGQGLRARAHFHRRFARFAGLVLLVAQLSLAPFYARCLGQTEADTVQRVSTQTLVDSDGDTYYEYRIEVRRGAAEIAESDTHRVTAGATVPLRVASDRNWQLGAWPTVQWWHGAVLGFGTLALWLGYKLRRRASRPWFRRKVNESGSGRLPEPPQPPRYLS